MFKGIKTTALRSTPILMGFLLVACGGGGGGGSSSSGVTAETSVKLAPGAFSTEIGFPDGSTVDAATLLSPSGDFVVFVDFDDITVGTLQFGNNSSITGSGTDYYYDASWETQSGTISGRASSTSEATIKATAPGYESNSTLLRDDQYSDLGVTLAQLSGTYTMDVTGVYRTTVTISADGTVTGSDETGCVFNGNVDIPDTEFNVYEVSYTASNCPESERNGQYSGLGAYDPDLAEIEFAGADGEVAAFFIGSK
ncbi:hypothetical protein [Marinobacter similis]|uniref:Lipoprotein n=1 Tax=Marinobacter similis TaxID=1420916 RepID=W5YL58_9GAMM|nr:hypothetical protein [Marinobacter similis]AHI29937.1 hypothetical protein AU14_01885 [Marinobacter similis]